MLSFVYSNPCFDTIINEGDQLLVVGNSQCIEKALAAVSLALARQPGAEGKFSLDSEVLKSVAAAEMSVKRMGVLKNAAKKFKKGKADSKKIVPVEKA